MLRAMALVGTVCVAFARVASAQDAAPAGAQGTARPTSAANTGGVSMRDVARSVAVQCMSRGAAAERDGHLIEADASYQQAIEADPGYLDAHLAHARILARRGFADAALRALSSVPTRALETEQDAVLLARTAASIGHLDAALALLGERTGSPEALRARVDLLAGAGRFPEALNAARALVEHSRASAEERAGARALVRALRLLVGDADAVRAGASRGSVLRRLLAE